MWSKIEEFADKQKVKLGFSKDIWSLEEAMMDKNKRLEQFLDSKKKHPLEWFVYVTMVDAIGDVVWPINRFFSNSLYRLKNGLKKRHYIKVGDFGDWPDADGIIFESIRKSLINFVEKECDNMYRVCFQSKGKIQKNKNYGLKYLRLYINDKESSKDLKSAYKNIVEAYEYFTKVRPQIEKDIEKKWNKKYKNSDECNERTKQAMVMEDFMYKEDTRYLNMVVNARGHMWT